MTDPTPAQRQQWDEQGYLVIEDAIQGAQLQRLQAAFDFWAGACRADWVERVARGDASPSWYDIPDPLTKDEIFVDMVDHPSYYDLLQDFTSGQLLFGGLGMRTVPAWPLAYTGWHSDVARAHPLHPKVQLYIEDVPPQGGEFGFVPGSHRVDTKTYYRGLRGRTLPRRNDTMPGHRTLPGKAGSAIVFNAYGLHTAMDNRTPTARKSIIMGYDSTRAHVEPNRYAALARFCTTPERRKLFGLEV